MIKLILLRSNSLLYTLYVAYNLSIRYLWIYNPVINNPDHKIQQILLKIRSCLKRLQLLRYIGLFINQKK
jgi:hypothetical protein